MKKNIILLIGILFLSGCTIKYDLEISEKKFNETIEIIEENPENLNKICEINGTNSYRDKIDWEYNQNTHTYIDAPINPYSEEKVDNVIYYEKEKINTNNKYGINMTTNGDIQDIKKLRSISYCYDTVQVLNNNNEYTITTSFKNNCFDDYILLDELNINITTDMKVLSHNANNVTNNTYTWKITRHNYQDKSISLVMESIQDYNKNENPTNIPGPNNKDKKSEKYIMYIFYGILIILVLIGYFIVKYIKNKNDKLDI